MREGERDKSTLSLSSSPPLPLMSPLISLFFLPFPSFSHHYQSSSHYPLSRYLHSISTPLTFSLKLSISQSIHPSPLPLFHSLLSSLSLSCSPLVSLCLPHSLLLLISLYCLSCSSLFLLNFLYCSLLHIMRMRER